MMLGEESESATYWKKAGDEALANGIKGVIMMVGPNRHQMNCVNRTEGRSLGCSWRSDRGRNKPNPWEESNRICSSVEICRLRA
jgi:hypothetical protein